MIKTRDKRTGAVNYTPTNEDKNRYKLINRIDSIEKRLNKLENYIEVLINGNN